MSDWNLILAEKNAYTKMYSQRKQVLKLQDKVMYYFVSGKENC